MSLIPGLYASPLRYPGGKGKVTNFIKLLMLENGLIGRDYVEPYCGGASVALSLLFEDYAERIHINDVNLGVYAFWVSVLNSTAEFCDLVERTPVTMAEWHRQRRVLLEPEDAGSLELGFATFFLNRTNRSGIISGGVIGGKNQSGKWKLDARFNKSDLIQRIRKIGRHRSRIALTNLDAIEFLAPWCHGGDSAPSFLYLDPPYYVKGEGLYDNFYDATDHQSIATMIGRVEHPWIVSYDPAPEIIGLYGSRTRVRYSLAYSAQTRGLGSEIMFFAEGLSVPGYAPSAVPAEVLLRARTG